MNSSKRLQGFIIAGLIGILFAAVGYGMMANAENSQPDNDNGNTMRANCIASGGSLFLDKETNSYQCNLGT